MRPAAVRSAPDPAPMLRLLSAIALLGLAACDSAPEPVTLTVQTATIDAGGSAFTHYALAEGRVVPSASAATSVTWDLGFRGAEVVLNSGPSGPGAAVGTFLETPFAEVDTVQTVGLAFRRDGESACPSGPARAVCSDPGSPFSPYVLSSGGALTPAVGRTLILRTGDAQGFAKVRFVSYSPTDPAAPAAGGTVTIEYLVNPYGRVLTPGTEVTP